METNSEVSLDESGVDIVAQMHTVETNEAAEKAAQLKRKNFVPEPFQRTSLTDQMGLKGVDMEKVSETIFDCAETEENVFTSSSFINSTLSSQVKLPGKCGIVIKETSVLESIGLYPTLVLHE